MSDVARLFQTIRDRTARVGIIGTGGDGLDLARAVAAAGFGVSGFDPGRATAERSPLNELVPAPADGFEATADLARLAELDVIVLCVPLPLTPARGPDPAPLTAVLRAAVGRLRTGRLLVLTSTSYPGTTRQVVLPSLAANKWVAGRDFFLAYSPSAEGPPAPRVVGGLEPESLELACAFFAHIAPAVIRASSLEVAELSPLLASARRAVCTALANELKLLCDRLGIDAWEAIETADGASSAPPHFAPGLGGGRCSIDPHYLAWIAHRQGLSTRLIELAGEVNAAMPAFVVGKVADVLNDAGKPVKGSRIMILGVASSKDADDPRESPGFEIMELLLAKGAHVSFNDPHLPTLPSWARRSPHLNADGTPLTPDSLAGQDCVLIATDHATYDYQMIVAHSRLVVDTRNATRYVTLGREKLVRA